MNRLKELRDLRGWNMKKAAQELEIPYTTYVGYEKGERGMDSEVLLRLANFYGVTVDYLICNDEYASDEDLDLVKQLQILRDREDLRSLLAVTSKKNQEYVKKLIDLFGSIPER